MQVTRRHFLGTVAGAALATGATPVLAWAPSDRMERIRGVPTLGDPPGARKHAEVIVLGAGVAGLAAARQLRAAGYSVILLEARDRVGGRVHSVRVNGLAVERGAGWIHGTTGNPIAIFAKQQRIGTRAWTWENAVTYDPTGKPYSAADLEKASTFVETTLDAIYARGEDVALGPTLRAALDVAARDGRLTAVQRKLADWYLESSVQGDLAEQIDRIGVAPGARYEDLPGDDAVFPDGYDAVPYALAKGLDVRFGVRVSAIDYSTPQVTIQTNNGTYTAAQVVCTLPLGVLKAGDVAFTPALPADKAGAIERIGVGLLNRVNLQFDRPFWPDTETLGFDSEGASPFTEFVNLQQVNGKASLVALVTADNARKLESLSDQAIVEKALEVLRRAYGDKVTTPIGTSVTRWGQDELARGSYSADTFGVQPGDRARLAAALAGRVFFAGEATHETHSATVHGAYETGIRVAREVAAALARRLRPA